jgi:small-conductance mechanosensitive channel
VEPDIEAVLAQLRAEAQAADDAIAMRQEHTPDIDEQLAALKTLPATDEFRRLRMALITAKNQGLQGHMINDLQRKVANLTEACIALALRIQDLERETGLG